MSPQSTTETPIEARPEYKISDWADTGPRRRKRTFNELLWRAMWNIILPTKGNPIGLTPTGFVHIMVSVGLLSAAYASSSNNILFMALSLVLSTLILSGLLSWMNFRGGRWRLLLPAHFRMDEPAPITVELWNTKRLLPTCCLWVNIRSQKEAKWERLYLEERLDPDQQAQLEWLFTPRARGVDHIEVSGLESQFPFGFLRKMMGIGMEREIVVTPRRVDYDFRMPVGRRGRQMGAFTRRPGSGAELMNIRRYQRGDPQKIVHWKATARTRQLMVRQTEEENRDGYIIFVETPDSIWREPAQFERLCSFAASLAEDLFRESRLVGVAMNDEPLLVIKRLHDLQLFLEMLARAEPTPGYKSASEHYGSNLITFKPGTKNQVHAYLTGNLAGSA
ncbi:DUF58 domain-containing protein [Cerasicoccus fimbriatus]|uniref:DUF58 domain-containing protein n=1 Tax=Cerasicoccus fimbriatus TaxID=3014554 RepID=UPI0022B38B31|nr:DUF58 domain-containing protein [Cerasicoccus sp. TK19100]